MDSCFALSINPQVLITTIFESSFGDSWVTLIPFPRSCVSKTSESTWFLEHPKVTILTLVFLLPLVFNFLRKLACKFKENNRRLRGTTIGKNYICPLKIRSEGCFADFVDLFKLFLF